MRSQTGSVVITVVLAILTDSTSLLTLLGIKVKVLADRRSACHIDCCFSNANHHGKPDNGLSLCFTSLQLRMHNGNVVMVRCKLNTPCFKPNMLVTEFCEGDFDISNLCFKAWSADGMRGYQHSFRWCFRWTLPHFASKSGVAIANCASPCATTAIDGNVAHSCEIRNRNEKLQRNAQVRRNMHLWLLCITKQSWGPHEMCHDSMQHTCTSK